MRQQLQERLVRRLAGRAPSAQEAGAGSALAVQGGKVNRSATRVGSNLHWQATNSFRVQRKDALKDHSRSLKDAGKLHKSQNKFATKYSVRPLCQDEWYACAYV